MAGNKVNFDNLSDFLKENYEEIYDAIQEERYILEYTENKHVIFKELKYNDKVVGFALVDLIMAEKPKYSVCECYIMPEYRGNNILFDFISNLSYRFCLIDGQVSLAQPIHSSSIIITIIGSYFILKEAISKRKLFMIIGVIICVFLLSI